MELYTLDASLRRTEVIDQFESAIWTDRYATIGEFNITVSPTPRHRALLTPETYLASNVSDRVMFIENTETGKDAEGRTFLKVSGRSLEAILESRIIRKNGSPFGDGVWTMLGTPGAIARKMFSDICIDGLLFAKDAIPFVSIGDAALRGTIPEPTIQLNWAQEPGVLYTALKEVLDPFDLGFRIVRPGDDPTLKFDVYSGNDRTAGQTRFDPVVFGPMFDNFQNVTEFNSIQKDKNVAYVYGLETYAQVFLDSTDQNISGVARRVLLVEANDLPADTADIPAALHQLGKQELRKHLSLSLFEGELTKDSGYIPGVHYHLGDVVETRNEAGKALNKRVTEQIFVQDAEGERTYPTLSLYGKQ